MGKTVKCFNLMSIYHPYACLKGESFITVKRVKNQKEARLSRSEGNVNLTDFWFSMLDNLTTKNMSCSCQNIGLLSDISAEEDDDWWLKQDSRYIGVGFLKIYSKSNMTISQTMDILGGIIGKDGRLFRTLDNADIIVGISVEKENRLQKLIEKIADYEKDGESIYFSMFFVMGKGKREDDAFRIKDLNIPEKKGRFCNKHLRYDKGWCAELSEDMVKCIGIYKREKNKKMMSYYQALFQILNVLGQYEQETLHKDLFYIFYPPISMFISQLKKSREVVSKLDDEIKNGIEPYSVKKAKIEERQERNMEIEKSISLFLDTMELLLHHIGQSCEDILGANHGGMPYDIPLRISLMYISFLNILSDVLVEKGEESKKEFEYCLSPLAYTQTTTTSFDIGDTDKSRLIRVKMPRHMLFMPRSFLVILAHGASHYAHETSRLRELRAKCMRKIVEHAMLMVLISDSTKKELNKCSKQEEFDVLEKYNGFLSDNLENYLEGAIYNQFELECNIDKKYYLDYLTEEMCEISHKIFYDANHDLERQVFEIDVETQRALRNVKKFPNLYEKITNIQKEIMDNAAYAVYNNELYHFLHSLKKNFREIYADLSAIRLLDLSLDDYLEAYLISESCLPDCDNFPPELLNRFGIVKHVLEQSGEDSWKEEGSGPVKEEGSADILEKMKVPIREYQKTLGAAAKKHRETEEENTERSEENMQQDVEKSEVVSGWFYSKEILAFEIDLFKECDQHLSEHIKAQENKAELSVIRNLHRSFESKPYNEDGSFSEFFEAFDWLTGLYKSRVNEKYKKYKKMREETTVKNWHFR